MIINKNLKMLYLSYFRVRSLLIQCIQVFFSLLILFSLTGCAGIIVAGATVSVNKVKIEKKIKQKNPPQTKLNPSIKAKQTKTRDFRFSKPAKVISNLKIPKALPKKRYTRLQIKTLNGLNKKRLITTIGKPIFIRKDGLAEIWRYNGTNCKLHVFFYQNQSTGDSFVKYLEILHLENYKPLKKQCLTIILKNSELSQKL